MDLDKFLRSQTFKTGVFVLFVIFALLFVFKLGVFHGYKKANFSHGYDATHYRAAHGTIFGYQNSTVFNHKKGMFSKEMFERTFLKKQLIKDGTVPDSATGDASDLEEIVE